MEWSESLSVGVEAIDSQHKELISRVNAFYASLRKENAKQETLKVLDFLSGYVVQHFRDEEAIQAKYNYPNYPEHRKVHKDFIESVQGIKADIEKDGVTTTSSSLIAMTLSNWLVNHISKMDKDIGRHIRENFPSDR
jgi:hemerythrin